MQFDIAGFTYYEGPLAFDQLKIGSKLKLESEADNAKDPDAVAIYFQGKDREYKLGYVPKKMNSPLCIILNAGHEIFEAMVNRVSPDAYPENQVMVSVHVMKAKGKK